MRVSETTIENMVLIIQSSLPMLLTLMIASGAVTSGTVFEPFIIFALQIVGVFIKKVLLPLIFFTAVLGIINSLTNKNFQKNA